MPGEKGHLEAKWAYTRSTDGSKVWRFGGLTEYNVSGGERAEAIAIVLGRLSCVGYKPFLLCCE